MAVNKVMLKSGKVLMDTSGVTVEPGTLYKGKTALDREGNLIEGTLEPGVVNEVEQAVPQITVSARGLVVASAMQEGGYVAAGTARSEVQLPVQAGKNIVPSTTDQVAVEAGKYTIGAVTVKGDANLVPENIAAGVSIFGVIGSLQKEDQPNIEGVEQAVPVIEVLPGGMITATAEQTAGYVAGGIKQAKMQLPVQAGKDVVPSMADQVAVETGKYTTGAVTVKGDANLVPENIAAGVSIFGVTGVHQGGVSPAVVTLDIGCKTEGQKINQVLYTTAGAFGVEHAVETINDESAQVDILEGSIFVIHLAENITSEVEAYGVGIIEIATSASGATIYAYVDRGVAAGPSIVV